MNNPNKVAVIGFVAMMLCLAGIMLSMMQRNIPAAGTCFMAGIIALLIIHSAVRRVPLKGMKKHGLIFLLVFQAPILFLIYESIRRQVYWVTPGIVFISLSYATLTHAVLSSLLEESAPNKSGGERREAAPPERNPLAPSLPSTFDKRMK